MTILLKMGALFVLLGLLSGCFEAHATSQKLASDRYEIVASGPGAGTDAWEQAFTTEANKVCANRYIIIQKENYTQSGPGVVKGIVKCE